MNELHHLIYRSSATKEYSLDQLDVLIKSARFNNLIYQITGLLLYGHGQFVQVLEGERSNIELVMDKILLDPRHTNIHIATLQPIKERAFPHWNMGLSTFNNEEIELKLQEQCGHQIHFDALSNFDACSIINSFSNDLFGQND